MKEEKELVDYAAPLMRVEKTTKEVSERCLDQKYEEARRLTLRLVAEVAMLHHVVVEMKEKNGNTK